MNHSFTRFLALALFATGCAFAQQTQLTSEQKSLLLINGIDPATVSAVTIQDGKVVGATMKSGSAVTVTQKTQYDYVELTGGNSLPPSTYVNPMKDYGNNLYGTNVQPSNPTNQSVVSLYTGGTNAGSSSNGLSYAENNWLSVRAGTDTSHITSVTADGKGGFSSATLDDGSTVNFSNNTVTRPDGKTEEYAGSSISNTSTHGALWNSVFGSNDDVSSDYQLAPNVALQTAVDNTYAVTGKYNNAGAYNTEKLKNNLAGELVDSAVNVDQRSQSELLDKNANHTANLETLSKLAPEIVSSAATVNRTLQAANPNSVLATGGNAWDHTGETVTGGANKIMTTGKPKSDLDFQGFNEADWAPLNTKVTMGTVGLKGASAATALDGTVHPFAGMVALFISKMTPLIWVMASLTGVMAALSLQKDGRWDNFSVRFFAMAGLCATCSILAVLAAHTNTPATSFLDWKP